MRVYWEERRKGQRLMLFTEDEGEVEVGAVRETPRGFDALAKTNTYDPGRAQKGFATMEEAKAFVEEFHPWDIFGGDLDMEVEPEVQRDPAGDESGQASAPAAEQPDRPAVPAETSAPAVQENDPSTAEEPVTRKRGLQFWKKD